MADFIKDNYIVAKITEGRFSGTIQVTETQQKADRDSGGFRKFFRFGNTTEIEKFFAGQEERELIINGFLNSNQSAIDLTKVGVKEFIKSKGLTRIAAGNISGETFFITEGGKFSKESGDISGFLQGVISEPTPQTLGAKAGDTAIAITPELEKRLEEFPGATIKFAGDDTQYIREPGPSGFNVLRGIRSEEELQKLRDDDVVTAEKPVELTAAEKEQFVISTPFFKEGTTTPDPAPIIEPTPTVEPVPDPSPEVDPVPDPTPDPDPDSTPDPDPIDVVTEPTPESTTSTPLIGQPQLVSFTTGPSQFKIWDVSGGTLRHVTAEEFKTRGFDQSQVQAINPGQVTLDRAEDESKVFATILGNRVFVETIEDFQDADFKFENVDIITPQQRVEGAKTGNIIRFTTGNQVYDISTGELVPITAQQFSDLGLDFADVKPIDPLNVGIDKDPSTQAVTVKIDGKNIRIRDMKQFDEAGLSRTIFLGPRAVAPSLGTLSNEIKWRSNLAKVWDQRVDLQEIYERPDNLSRGESKDSRTEGTSMETWAMLHGWLDEPELLEAWRPENAVRVNYWQIFGQDPFDVATLQQDALKWAESVRVGDITSVSSLRGRINLDNGTTYDDLPEDQQQQITIDWLIEPEEVVQKGIPSFSEFFDEQAARERIKKETEAFFNVEMNNFLQERGIEERRSIEDWARLTIGEDLTDDEIQQLQKGETNVQDLRIKLEKEGRETGGELTELQERDLTSIEKQFRNTLFQATEGFGQRGLTFSSLRVQEENQLRESLARGSAEIQKSFDRQREASTLAKERTIETLTQSQRQLEAEQKVEIPKEIETALTQEREIQRESFKTLREQAGGSELSGGIT